MSDAIFYRDGKEFDLLAFTIMFNHVHLLFHADTSGQTEDIAHAISLRIGRLKSFTARVCNNILDRTGQFWQYESYDHIVATDKELEDTIWYILNNPVKAGLVKRWQDWKWSYSKFEITL